MVGQIINFVYRQRSSAYGTFKDRSLAVFLFRQRDPTPVIP
jgi:hypothetical protein